MVREGSGSASYTLVLRSDGDQSVTVLFEPAAGQFELGPGEEFWVEISGPATERIELTHGDGYMSLWPGPALSLRVTNARGEDVPLIGY